MRRLKYPVLGLLMVLILGILGFTLWAAMPLRAAPEALAAMQSDQDVTVSEGRYITFAPSHQDPAETGFIFYPGGHVEARSYAAPLRQIAAGGYLVILVPVRFGLAIFDGNAAGPVIAAYPEIKHWVIGGHSLGGVAAAQFAGRHSQIDGLVLWASYPPDDSLKDSGLRVLSIYGTQDMGGAEQFEQKRLLLPEDTRSVVIAGGNHSQFGDYGLQPGDHPAQIPRLEQQSQTVQAVIMFLASFVK